MVVGQGGQPLLHRLPDLLPEQRPFRVLDRVAGLGPAAVLVVHRGAALHILPPLSLAEKVQTDIAGQAVDPSGKAAAALKGWQSAPGVKEGLLGQVLSVAGITGHAQTEGIDPFLIIQHQLLKGGLISGFCPGDQLLLGHGDPLLSSGRDRVT